MKRHFAHPVFVAAAAVASLSAVAVRAVSVADGFPDPSGSAYATSEPLSAFDSFVASRASAAVPPSAFHSFVSSTHATAPLDRFRSDAPAGLVLVFR